MQKADYVVVEVLDERGRYWTEQEFKWILNYFKDRYDPRRLSIALARCCGLRIWDAVYAKINWFSPDFSYMKMSQCKPHISKSRAGKITIRKQPRKVPIPEWLAQDLRAYIKYRLLVAEYIGEGLKTLRLFPSLKRVYIQMLFCKLRKRHGSKEKWLMDIWQVLKAFDKQGNLLWQRPYFRIAPHAARADYCTKAHFVSDGDLIRGQKITGHKEVRHYEKYVKFVNLDEDKEKVKLRMEEPIQQTPILKGQKSLSEFQKFA